MCILMCLKFSLTDRGADLGEGCRGCALPCRPIFGSTWQTDMYYELHSSFPMEAVGSCLLLVSKFPSAQQKVNDKFYETRSIYASDETVTCAEKMLNFWEKWAKFQTIPYHVYLNKWPTSINTHLELAPILKVEKVNKCPSRRQHQRIHLL